MHSFPWHNTKKNHRKLKRTIKNQKEPSKIKKNQLKLKRTSSDHTELSQIKKNQLRSNRTIADQIEPSQIKMNQLRSERNITEQKLLAQILKKTTLITQNYHRSNRTCSDQEELSHFIATRSLISKLLWFDNIPRARYIFLLQETDLSVGLFDLQKLLNLVIKLLFVLHGFSTMTSSIKILLFDLHGLKPQFQNSFETFETTSGGSS